MKRASILLPLTIITLMLITTASPTIAESLPPQAAATPFVVPKVMMESVYRVQHEFGSGSGFAVDLSAFGIPGNRFLITAAHVAIGPDESPISNIKIRINHPDFRKRTLARADVVAYDIKYDICVLRADVDLPVRVKIAMEDKIGIGEPIVTVGCPAGASPLASMGFLADKVLDLPDLFDENIWLGSSPIFFGNSGGPVFDAIRGDVIGIAVLCLGNGRGVAPNTTGMVSTPCLRKFLKDNVKRIS